MDYGHVESDRKLKKLESRIEKEYMQATMEVEAKLDKFLERSAKAEAVMKSKLDNGQIGFNEYLDWVNKQTVLNNKWFDMRRELADVYLHADAVAMSMLNEHRFDVYALNYNYGTYEVEKLAKINTMFTLYDKDTVMRLVKDNPKLLPPIGKETSNAIRRGELKKWNQRQIQSVMTQSIIQGESIKDMSKRLAQTMGEKNAYQHYRAARTMTTSAENAGRLDSYRRAEDMGIKMGKTWLAVHDEHTRESHVEMDGVTVDVDEKFPNELMFPADPDGDPSEVYNCRCTLVATVLSVNGVDISDITTSKSWDEQWNIDYDAWKNGHASMSELTTEQPNTDRDKIINNAQEFSAEYHRENNWDDEKYYALPIDQRNAIEAYTGSSYEGMNEVLRGVASERKIEMYRDKINDCTDGLNNFKLADDTMLYRGMCSARTLSGVLGVDSDNIYDLLDSGALIGQTFIEKGFCSTGISKEKGWDKEVRLEIVAPQGTVGMYVNPISHFKSEQEVLLQRGAQYEIIGVTKERDDWRGEDVYWLKVFLLGQNPERF